MSSDKSLKDLLCVLADSGVPFIVVGGYAARMHGTSLLTEDIDVCAILSPENVSKLREVLAPFHPIHRMTPQKLPLSEFPSEIKGINNLYVGTDLGKVDFLGSVGGVGSFEQVAKNAVEVTVFGRKCRVISIDDLIKAKKFMNRPHDIETVKQLEWIKNRVKSSETP
jgi:predicted nucleotidyltransferase